MWAESSQNVLGDDDLIQLEDLFRKKPAKAKRRADQKAKSQRRLFDIKRENNVAIALVKLKKTFPEGFRPMVDAIESQDLAKLPLQSVRIQLFYYSLFSLTSPPARLAPGHSPFKRRNSESLNSFSRDRCWIRSGGRFLPCTSAFGAAASKG